MKILFVLHDYLPEHVGGTEIHAHRLARELSRRGHELTALFTERRVGSPEGSAREGRLDGVRTIEVVHWNDPRDATDAWLNPASLPPFERALERVEPDLVHFHHLARWGPACLERASEGGRPAILHLHDYYALCHNCQLLLPDGELCEAGASRAADRTFARDCEACLDGLPAGNVAEHLARGVSHRLALERAARLISPSLFLADVLQGSGMARENGIELLRYGLPGAVHPPRVRPAGSLRVGFVGGLYPSKGAHVLIEALGLLRGEPVELEVFGALEWFPSYVASLRDRAAGLLARFRGRFDPDRADEVYAGIDLLVVPSLWYENWPLTIQDAYRCGVPVVASDLGGMAEAVEDGVSGRLFPRGDAAALAGILRRLAGDRDELARLARGRPPVPTLEEEVDRLVEIYAEVMAR